MVQEDPISGNQYEETIDGFKRWASNELNNGLPIVYAITGFLFVIGFTGFTTGIATIFLGWNVPTWVFGVSLVLGVFWGYGGWINGQRAEEKLETNNEFEDESDDEFKY